MRYFALLLNETSNPQKPKIRHPNKYLLGSIVALLYGAFLIFKILKSPSGSGKMLEIAAAIQAGAKAYLSRQYKAVAVVGVVIVALMYATRFFTQNYFSNNTIYGFILG